MSLVSRYVSALPAIVEVNGEEIRYGHMLPLWYYLMARYKIDFKLAVLAIREAAVRMKINKQRPASAASQHLLRDIEKQDWEGHMTNPDTVLFCRVHEGRLESLDEITATQLDRFCNEHSINGLLTQEQFDSLPELYQSVLDRGELPILIFSDAASVWFDAN